jgi:hypothetical protein
MPESRTRDKPRTLQYGKTTCRAAGGHGWAGGGRAWVGRRGGGHGWDGTPLMLIGSWSLLSGTAEGPMIWHGLW